VQCVVSLESVEPEFPREESGVPVRQELRAVIDPRHARDLRHTRGTHLPEDLGVSPRSSASSLAHTFWKPARASAISGVGGLFEVLQAKDLLRLGLQGLGKRADEGAKVRERILHLTPTHADEPSDATRKKAPRTGT
jgi:hypothetical protein